MGEKSARRVKLERALADDPADPFLRYGLAVQCLAEGDAAEGRDRLRALIAERPEAAEVVPAYQQLGQSYLESDEPEAARAALEAGIALARARGDAHAAAEMGGLLDGLG